MRVGFRVGGGGGGIGLGHIIRCVALAEAFREKNVAVSFVCEYPFALQLIKQHGFHVEALPLGFSQKEDLHYTLKAFDSCAIIVADDYGFSGDYLKGLAQEGHFIVCLDDKMDRSLPVDIVLGNAYASLSNYQDKISQQTALLSGPAYIPMRREYSHSNEHAISEKIERVFINFGGEDIYNVTQKIVDALKNEKEIHRIVVVGGAYPFYNELKESLESSQVAFELHRDVENVKPLQQSADVAFSAAGTTVWELAAVGTPMVLIQAADNQDGTIAYIKQNQLALFLGHHKEIQAQDIVAALAAMRDQSTRKTFSKKFQDLIDGRGSERVVDAILKHFEERKMTLRAILDKDPGNSDSRLLWAWRNDPITREMSRSSDFIPWELHCDWYVKTLEDKNEVLLFADFQGEPVGTVRFDIARGHVAEVSINMDPAVRGKGLGRKLLAAACYYGFKKLHLKEIDAEIKEKNEASIHLFESVGFCFVDSSEGIRKYVKRGI